MPLYVESGHPLVVRASFVDIPSDGQLTAYFAQAEALLEARRGTPFIVVVDARRGGTPPVSHLKLHAAFLRRNADGLRTGLLGVVFLASNPMLRGAIKALFWLQPSAAQVEVRATLAEASELSSEWLEERGISGELPTFADDPAREGEAVQASA